MNIERLKAAFTILSAIPASNWNMRIFYTDNNHCGCAIGHLAHRGFEGLQLEGGCPVLRETVVEGELIMQQDYTGIDAGDRLFDLTFSGFFSPLSTDEKVLSLSDKEAFFRRVRLHVGEALFRSLFEGTEQEVMQQLETEGVL